MAQKKVLVTGATGFIGNYVVEALLQRGCSVVASSMSPEKAKASPWFNRVTYLPFNFNTARPDEDYFTYFTRPDLLIHLAWEGLPQYNAEFHLTKNLPVQTTFLQNMLQHGLKDLTVTGTCFEYGMKEGCLSEEMDCNPDNAYAIAKNALRITMEKLTLEFGSLLKWVRLFYMYGKGQSPKSLISQLDSALANGDATFNMSGGEQVRDFLPVEAVAANIVNIALQQEVTGIINCCSGKPVMLKDFVKEYLALQQKEIQLNLGFYPYAGYEPMRFWGNNEKLKSIVGN